jgi:hypothetical protein
MLCLGRCKMFQMMQLVRLRWLRRPRTRPQKLPAQISILKEPEFLYTVQMDIDVDASYAR